MLTLKYQDTTKVYPKLGQLLDRQKKKKKKQETEIEQCETHEQLKEGETFW